MDIHALAQDNIAIIVPIMIAVFTVMTTVNSGFSGSHLHRCGIPATAAIRMNSYVGYSIEIDVLVEPC